MSEPDQQNCNSNKKRDPWINAKEFRDFPTSDTYGADISYYDTVLWVCNSLFPPNGEMGDIANSQEAEAELSIRQRCDKGESVAWGQKNFNGNFEDKFSNSSHGVEGSDIDERVFLLRNGLSSVRTSYKLVEGRRLPPRAIPVNAITRWTAAVAFELAVASLRVLPSTASSETLRVRLLCCATGRLNAIGGIGTGHQISFLRPRIDPAEQANRALALIVTALKREVTRLKAERAILKKAAAYFAKEAT